eukprot:291688-Rhodomonas_salina.2
MSSGTCACKQHVPAARAAHHGLALAHARVQRVRVCVCACVRVREQRLHVLAREDGVELALRHGVRVAEHLRPPAHAQPHPPSPPPDHAHTLLARHSMSHKAWGVAWEQ